MTSDSPVFLFHEPKRAISLFVCLRILSLDWTCIRSMPLFNLSNLHVFLYRKNQYWAGQTSMTYHISMNILLVMKQYIYDALTLKLP